MNIIGTTTSDELIVTMTREEYAGIPPVMPSDNVVLPYVHVSQMGAGAAQNRNDCGAACVASCAKTHGFPNVTVDEIAGRYMRPNQPMHIHEVRAALGGYGMANGYKRPLTAVDIAEHIVNERLPVVALVSYHALPHHAAGYEAYHYAHYILVYGVHDERLLYHDPLMKDNSQLSISFSRLNLALKSEGNLPDQGILLINTPDV